MSRPTKPKKRKQHVLFSGLAVVEFLAQVGKQNCLCVSKRTPKWGLKRKPKVVKSQGKQIHVYMIHHVIIYIYIYTKDRCITVHLQYDIWCIYVYTVYFFSVAVFCPSNTILEIIFGISEVPLRGIIGRKDMPHRIVNNQDWPSRTLKFQTRHYFTKTGECPYIVGNEGMKFYMVIMGIHSLHSLLRAAQKMLTTSTSVQSFVFLTIPRGTILGVPSLACFCWG